MTIELKPEQERIIQEEIRSGHFRNVDEVLDHALAALREKSAPLVLDPGNPERTSRNFSWNRLWPVRDWTERDKDLGRDINSPWHRRSE
jgi:hypothetical protein